MTLGQIAENPALLKEEWIINILESFKSVDETFLSQILRVFFSLPQNYAAAVSHGVSDEVSEDQLHEILSAANATIILNLFNNTQISA